MKTIDISTEGGVLLLTFTGEIKDMTDVHYLKSDIEVVSKTIKNMHAAGSSGVKVLIDISHFTASYINEGVEALVELAKQDEGFVQKTGIFGGSLSVKAIGETIVALSGRTNIKFFETKRNALDWLKS